MASQDMVTTSPSAPPSSKRALSFNPTLAYEIALGYDSAKEVLLRHGVSKERFRELCKYPPFIRAVKQFKKEIAEQGVTFKMKSRLLAEDVLEDAYLLAKDPGVPVSVRTKNIENIVRWGELEPQKGEKGSGVGGPQFNIQINLGD